MAAQLHRIAQNGVSSSLTPSLSPIVNESLNINSTVFPTSAVLDNVSSPTSSPTVLPNNYTANNPNEIPVFNFIIYLFMCMCVLVALVYCNQRKAAAQLTSNTTAASPANSNNAATTNSQQLDLVRNMTPEQRKEYVTNFLKTQKFVKKDSSFRITQSSSFRIHNDTNDYDIESKMSLDGAVHYPSCAICLERFQVGEDVCSAQNKDCPHEFHLACIFPWLLKSQDCPCCRRDYLSVETDVNSQTNG